MKAIVITVLALIISACGSSNDESIMPSLKASALDTVPQWSEYQVALVVKITARHLKEMDSVLLEADKKGDRAAALSLYDPLIHTLQTWNDHQSTPGVPKYRDCILAIVNLSDAVTSVANGGRYNNRDRFQKSLSGCNP